MVSEKSDTKRRKSMAAIQHARPSVGGRRRRAHSMVPGSNSPLNRRNLQPRKSILKIPVTIIPNRSRLSNATSDDSHGTESMELTRRVSMQPRPTLSRRISFATRAHVRVIANVADTTVSSTASSSSTPPQSPSDNARPSSSRPSTDENDYPGSISRRRSSLRQSMATEDMDITAKWDFSSDDGFESDPDVAENDSSQNKSTSTVGDQSRTESESDGEGVQHMEYTIPLSQPLKSPGDDPAYVALMQATHAGSSVDSSSAGSQEGDDSMDLEEAENRLLRARNSLGKMSNNTVDISTHDDSLSSMEQDDDEVLAGDETINLSRILSRPSFGAMSAHTSFSASTMDISEDFVGTTFHSTPRPSLAPSEPEGSPFKVDAPVIPQRPINSSSEPTTHPPASPSKPQLTIPRPFVFSKPPSSPSKVSPAKGKASTPASPAKPKPQFTAAFAPPVPRPSLRKKPGNNRSPNKRPRESENDLSDAGRPSPAKRQAVADRWSSNPTDRPETSKPKPLSPSKRAPFQAHAQVDSHATQSSTTPQDIEKPPLQQRPSSYFARRKSFIPTPSAAISQTTSTSKDSSTAIPTNKRQAGRQSTGATLSGVSVSFDKAIPAPTISHPVASDSHSVQETGVEKVEEPTANRNERLHIVDDASETPTMASVQATERWRSQVEQAPEAEEATPQISIKQFFDMTEVAFMDELQAPRRSMHPAHLQRESRNPEDVPLSEYAIAVGIDLPQLKLYKRVAEDLEGWVHKSKTVNMKQAEEEAALVTPELFVEYVRAEEDGQADIVHQLKLIKTNARAKAKSDWYEWKLRWVEDLEQDGAKVFNALTEDAKSLSHIQHDIGAILPDLQQKYDAIMAQLEQEQSDVVDIEGSDQEYLNDLKLSIQEQSIEVESLRVEVNDQSSQLTWLEERLIAIEQEERETRTAIAEARRFHEIRLNSTRADVFRLKDELKALEHLHMTTVTKVQPSMFEFIYSDQFRVTIPCNEHVPIISRVHIHWEPEAQTISKESLPGLRNFFLKAAIFYITNQKGLTTRQIVQGLSDFWSSCGQVRKQLEFLQIKFPLELEYFMGNRENLPLVKVHTNVLFPTQRSRATVSFGLPLSVCASWPRSYQKIRCNAETVYGRVQPTEIQAAILQGMQDSRPEQNPTWLLDACSFAVEVHDH